MASSPKGSFALRLLTNPSLMISATYIENERARTNLCDMKDITLLTVSVVGLLLSASTAVHAQSSFSIVVLPDTQNYVTSSTNAAIFTSQTQWIRNQVQGANERNIAFVSHVGDIVSTAANAIEWQRAVASMNQLKDGAGFVLPYGILPGNHDFGVTSNKSTGTATYVSNFGPATFSGATWYRGADPSGANSYQIFTAGGREYLHLALEWQPTVNVPQRTPSPVQWAKSVMAAHPTLPVILSTHEYVDDVPPGRSAAGDALFNELVRSNDQIFLVLCGHFHSGNNTNSGEWHQVSTNNFGKPVVEILQDFQDYSNGGNGWLRILKLDEGAGSISVETYSPWLNQFQTETVAQVGGYASQFSIPLDFAQRFDFAEPPLPPVEIYDEVVFQQGVNGYSGTQDKEVRSSGGDSANGNNVSISVDGDDGSPGLQPNHGLFKFEGIVGKGPGQIAPGTEIEQAFLSLNVIDAGSGFRAYAMTTNWSEATTWVSLGGNGVTPGVECQQTPFFSIGADNSSANVAAGTLTIDVTAQVRAWIDGSLANQGFALIPFTNGTNGVDISTSESGSPPRLVIRSLKEGLVQTNLRRGLDGYAGARDTQLMQSAPTVSQATATSFSVDTDDPNGSGNANHVLLGFSEISVAPGEVVRASLFLSGVDGGNGGRLHRTLLPWTDSATWADSFGGNGVQADGVEARVAPDALAVGSTGEVEIDVTAAVRDELAAGAGSINWVILPLGNDGWDVVSSEGAAALRPRLSITVAEAASIPGDIDGDGVVGGKDLAQLLDEWGGSGAGDIDGNGVVDGNDLAIVLAAWGG